MQSTETFDAEVFIPAIILPEDNISFLRMKRVPDTEVEVYMVDYHLSGSEGQEQELEICIQWIEEHRVLRFAVCLDLPIVDVEDEVEMDSLRVAIDELNATPSLASKVMPLLCDQGTKMELGLAITIPVPMSCFGTAERREVLAHIAGAAIERLIFEVASVLPSLEESLRKGMTDGEEGVPRVLQ